LILGRLLERADEKMEVFMAARKAVEASPEALDAGTPIQNIHEIGKTPMAALVLLLLFSDGMPPMEIWERIVAPMAAQKVWAAILRISEKV
jgi:hypothetical protein